jgi:hypothetical protein
VWIYLLIKTRDGKKAVRFTNNEALRLGLDHRNKMRELHALEARGLVELHGGGNKTSLVRVILPAENETTPLLKNDVTEVAAILKGDVTKSSIMT